jgi:hypothetical protein
MREATRKGGFFTAPRAMHAGAVAFFIVLP